MLEQLVINDLENLSSTKLYSGKIWIGGMNGGFVDSASAPGFASEGSSPSFRANDNLTVRDFPALSFQLHIHEDPDGKAKLKGYDGEKLSELNSYDAAMADGGPVAYDAMEKLQEYYSQWAYKSVRKMLSELSGEGKD
jgi:hypothetical protein